MKNIKTISLSSKGQVVIPEEFRKELHMQTGANLVTIKHGKMVIIMREKEVLRELKDEFADLDKISAFSLKDIWDNKEDDKVWSKYLS